MAKVHRALVQTDVKWSFLSHHLRFFRRFFRFLRNRVLTCYCTSKAPAYSRIKRSEATAAHVVFEPAPAADIRASVELPGVEAEKVALKICLLGDRQTGKTSFMSKYVGDGEEQKGLQMTGLNLMDKIFHVGGGVEIVYSMWDVAGDHQDLDHLPLACKDASAVLIMFDLTCRRTLNSVIGWYRQARKWNKTAIPVLIGTKFDDFVQLPVDMQWAIVNQARTYAQAMNATLFFSSSTHDINVNKTFKFIAAKLFNLPWTVERNLTLGEPIIDF